MRLQPFALEGVVVRLEPLQVDHVDDLVRAANQDRSSYGFTSVPKDHDSAVSYVSNLLEDAANDTDVPFVQRRQADGAVVGCTRFLNVTWWRGRDTPAEVEIGGTWLSVDAQRTAINTEAKLLLMTHAFDEWAVHRIAICTAADNERSRRAIERLGAVFEGVLRNHRASIGDAVTRPGLPRDSAIYSVVDLEWPAVRAGLQARLRAG